MKNIQIAFCGMDGAGKSTLARMAHNWLEVNEHRAIFLHGHTYSLSKKSLSLSSESVVKYRFLLRMAIPISIIDNLYTYYFKYRAHLKKANLITDRYFYDKLARLLFYGISTPFLARIHCFFIPRPTILFVLNPNPESASQRKGEYSVSDSKVFHEKYNLLSKILKIETINTSAPIEESWLIVERVLELNFSMNYKK